MHMQRFTRTLRESYVRHVRFFTTTSTNDSNKNKNQAREARFLNKMMGGSSKHRTWHAPSEGGLPSATNIIGEKKGKSGNRRVVVLSKVFMKYISNFLATGEIAPEIEGKGVQLVKVKIAEDINAVNVFWYAVNTDDVDGVEKILKKNQGLLRHELSQLRVIGEVPKINFVRDKNYEKIAEVERLLAKADFGPDFVPHDHSHYIKSEFVLNSTLKPELKAKILQLEAESLGGCSSESPDEPLPPMRNDVLGLDHASIMSHITTSMKKAEAPHRKDEQSVFSSSDSMKEEVCSDELDPVIVKRKADFAKFLLQRKIAKNKAMKNYQPETDYYVEEQERKLMFEYAASDENINDVDDFDEDIDDDHYKVR